MQVPMLEASMIEASVKDFMEYFSLSDGRLSHLGAEMSIQRLALTLIGVCFSQWRFISIEATGAYSQWSVEIDSDRSTMKKAVGKVGVTEAVFLLEPVAPEAFTKSPLDSRDC